jgi:hypothetical protein
MTVPVRSGYRLGEVAPFEDGIPPRFWLRCSAQAASVETLRPEGARQVFMLRDQGGYLESIAEIPEPHAFTANVRIGQGS